MRRLHFKYCRVTRQVFACSGRQEWGSQGTRKSQTLWLYALKSLPLHPLISDSKKPVFLFTPRCILASCARYYHRERTSGPRVNNLQIRVEYPSRAHNLERASDRRYWRYFASHPSRPLNGQLPGYCVLFKLYVFSTWYWRCFPLEYIITLIRKSPLKGLSMLSYLASY